jgi:hypothetical protein
VRNPTSLALILLLAAIIGAGAMQLVLAGR